MSRDVYEVVRGIVQTVLHQNRELPIDEAVTMAVVRVLETHVCAICHQEASRPDLRGTMWRRKVNPWCDMTYSTTLIALAGGLDKLLADYEQVMP